MEMRRTRLIFEQNYVTLQGKAVALIIIACLSILQITACSSSESEIKTTEVELEPEQAVLNGGDFVSLSEIVPPSFMQRFAIMYCNGSATNVLWGATKDNLMEDFFWSQSSYPGFGYTVIIQDDYFDLSDTVSISTQYGAYFYESADVYDVYLEDNKIIDRATGANLISDDAYSEILLIYSSIQQKAYLYKLKKGTTITIE